jgi:hypothetical protein
VIASDRKKVEQEEIPEFFTPVTGKRAMRGEHNCVLFVNTPEYADTVDSSHQGLC